MGYECFFEQNKSQHVLCIKLHEMQLKHGIFIYPGLQQVVGGQR